MTLPKINCNPIEMPGGTRPAFFIKLVVESPLEEKEIKSWYNTAKKYMPSGVISPVMIPKKNEGMRPASLIKRINDGRNEYIIPISRNLLNAEIADIVRAWDDIYKKNFDIEGSLDEQRQPDDAIDIDEDRYEKLCETLAQHQHKAWCNERKANGWSYGLSFDKNQKTHPMIRDWNELPSSYKNIDRELPQVFLEELNRLGYFVTTAEALARTQKK